MRYVNEGGFEVVVVGIGDDCVTFTYSHQDHRSAAVIEATRSVAYFDQMIDLLGFVPKEATE